MGNELYDPIKNVQVLVPTSFRTIIILIWKHFDIRKRLLDGECETSVLLGTRQSVLAAGRRD